MSNAIQELTRKAELGCRCRNSLPHPVILRGKNAWPIECDEKHHANITVAFSIATRPGKLTVCQ